MDSKNPQAKTDKNYNHTASQAHEKFITSKDNPKNWYQNNKSPNKFSKSSSNYD